MPWKESRKVDERMKFISRYLDGETVTDLCKVFEISRKTAYKFIERFSELGTDGLHDAKRGPKTIPHKTNPSVEKLIIKLRTLRPTWGPKKIKARLEKLNPNINIPAASTIGEILNRNNIEVNLQKRRKRSILNPYTPLTESLAPNDVWCIDFKGQFRMGNKRYCYPLTVTDHKSRYLLGCEALPSTKRMGVVETFERVFTDFGLPKVILSDNGTPFASHGVGRLSRLSVWFLRLGINPEQIEPGHPEQNGRHERMHRTLKAETIRPAGKNLLQQQEKFDEFMDIYNNERPHEALKMGTPNEHYQKSKIIFNNNIQEINYDLCDDIRKVSSIGRIRIPGDSMNSCFLGTALEGEKVGLTMNKDASWEVRFMSKSLGQIIKIGHSYKLI